MTEQNKTNKDLRTPLEKAGDLVDPRLFDDFQVFGLIGETEDGKVSVEAARNSARNAYLQGIRDYVRDPKGTDEFSRKFIQILDSGSPSDQIAKE